jgi:hypothetical protein
MDGATVSTDGGCRDCLDGHWSGTRLRGRRHTGRTVRGWATPPQLSLVEDGVTLAQPRLVADGDTQGGRYVSDVVDVYAGVGPAH